MNWLKPGVFPVLRSSCLPRGQNANADFVGVGSRAELEEAVRLFDERGVRHGQITRLPSFGIDILEFRDPDNIQLELTAAVV